MLRKLSMVFIVVCLIVLSVMVLPGNASSNTEDHVLPPQTTSTTTIAPDVSPPIDPHLEAARIDLERKEFIAAIEAQTTTTVPPTTAYTAPPTTVYVAPETTAPAPPPPPPPPPPPTEAVSSGRCGGDLPPCYVMQRESGGDPRIWNGGCHAPVGYAGRTSPCGVSSASGKWQAIRSTWGGYGGYLNAADAPESVQDAWARQLWAGGRGCSHWSAC